MKKEDIGEITLNGSKVRKADLDLLPLYRFGALARRMATMSPKF